MKEYLAYYAGSEKPVRIALRRTIHSRRGVELWVKAREAGTWADSMPLYIEEVEIGAGGEKP